MIDKPEIKEKLKDFSKLLDSIDNLEDKKKSLWREIYQNAITDRDNAYTMFLHLHELVIGDGTQHAIHGPNIAKYLERMSRSTDQLIKLAELIANETNKEQSINPDEIFKKIRG
jgi:hypothetical protein